MYLRGLAGGAAVTAGLLLWACPLTAVASTPGGGSFPSESHCFNPTQSNADFEAYGPTDVNAQAGDGRLTVNENSAGTLTVFKYPNPSYYNQIKYLAVGRDAHGRASAQYPNEGSFAGVEYRTAAGDGFSWLRDWRSTQLYDSPDTPVPVTVYTSPRRLGLTVVDVDLVVPGTTRFTRELWIRRTRHSSVRSARLVYFENFNPVATRLTYAPLADWCLTPLSDQLARYDPTNHAIVNWWQGTDQASGQPSAAAVAVGFDRADIQHQVGADSYEVSQPSAQSVDAYVQADRPPHLLGGSSSATGQSDGALALGLHFDSHGLALARILITAADTPAAALTALQSARRATFAGELGAVSRDWRLWLARTQLPKTTDGRVVAVAKRTLITARLAIDPSSGAIVASSDTQGPYGEDWIRDGAFINQLFDLNGYQQVVTRHNLFYASVQTSVQHPSPIRPAGNWAMAYYGDGVDGAPIPWEIDETGLGIWALQSHAAFMPPATRAAYLRQVFPAIARSADFLTLCQDPVSGLQCQANEDDNPTPSETLHGAEATELGLRAALATANALGVGGAEALAWKERLARLDQAIDALYDPTSASYREGNSAGNAYDVSYGDGGWLLWPTELHPYTDARMRGEATAVQRSMDASLRSGQGEYEAKALLGLAHAWSAPTPAQGHDLHSVLSYLASSLTTPTGLFGEAWRRFGAKPVAEEDMPHVWEHTLFYLSALLIDGARRYSFSAHDFVWQACRHRSAPKAACRVGGRAGAGNRVATADEAAAAHARERGVVRGST